MNVLKCVINYFKKHIFVFIFVILIIITVTLLSLVPPQLLRIIVDDVIPSGNINDLLKYALFYMLLFIFIGLIDFLKEILLVVISQGIGKNIRLEMLHKVNRLAYINFFKYDYGTLEAYFSNDVEEINTLITSGVISMAIDMFKMIGIVISIFVFSILFGFITLLIIPFIVLFTMWIRKRMYKAQSDNRKLEGNVNNLVLENLDNISTIKSFRIYDEIKNKYDKVLNSHFKTNQKVNNYDAMFSPIMQIAKTIIIVLIIVLSTSNNQLFGMTVEKNTNIKAWSFEANSPMRELYRKILKDRNLELEEKAVHGGLETGVFKGLNPKMDIITMGAISEGAHTPDEKLDLASFDRTYTILCDFLKESK